MSFASVNTVPHYSAIETLKPGSLHAMHNGCVLLPPLRAPGFAAASGNFTLSDCSELSTSTSARDDTLPAGLGYHMAQRSPRSPVAVMPASGRRPADATRAKGGKAHKKVGRARTRVSRGDGPPAACAGAGAGAGTALKAAGPTTKKVRSSKSNIPGESRYWTPSEHRLFVEALLKYGPKDLKSISAYVGTRNMIQCRTHEQKCFMRLMREAQRETMQRNGQDPDALVDCNGKKVKPQKDVYSVPSSCGISLLCVVSEEMTRSLQS